MSFRHQGSQQVTTPYGRADTWFDRNERLIFWTIMALPYLIPYRLHSRLVIWDARHPPRPVKSAERRLEELRKDHGQSGMP